MKISGMDLGTKVALVATMVVVSLVGVWAGAWAQTQPTPQALP